VCVCVCVWGVCVWGVCVCVGCVCVCAYVCVCLCVIMGKDEMSETYSNVTLHFSNKQISF